MKILFIGGTGNISTACVERELAMGNEVTLFNRGKTGNRIDPRIKQLVGNRHSQTDLARAAREHYDVVADFCAFVPDDVRNAATAFKGHTAQYIFISSVAAYEKPPTSPFVTEKTPLGNPIWPYAQAKANCETELAAHADAGLPVTIIRPGYTYGPTWIPAAVGGHNCALLHRLREGKPIISHGDGQGLIALTHNSDFASAFSGLAGNPRAVGQAVHVLTDEYLTWDQVYTTIATEAGCQIEILHIPSDYIDAIYPDWGERILGEKAYSLIFDLATLKSLVPDYAPAVPFAEGIRRSIAWHDALPAHCSLDTTVAQRMDLIAERFMTDRQAAIDALRTS